MSTTLQEIKSSSILTWEKGNQDDFERWMILLEMRLTEKDSRDCMTTNWGEGSTATADEKKKDLTACCLILTKTKGIAFKMIKNLKSAKEMWVKLADCYLVSKDPTLRANNLFNKWNKSVVFKSNQYSDPNG